LEGELRVTIVKVTKGKQETFQFDEPNALPVREGDGMGLQVHYQQPAHTYLIWLDSQGNVTPLYPWNMDNIDVKDANMAPPHCIATKNIFNPITIGGTWKFAKGSGLETIILLARRTPLDAEVKLHALLGGIAPAKVSDPGEAAVLSLDKGATSATSLKAINRGTVDEARARDQALTAQLEKLREHFELIRVVRFAHADK
jgi:hypothetical protein